MTDIRSRIADVLGSHEAWQRPDRSWECACGQAFRVKVNYDRHVANWVLSLPGIAIVELPEPDYFAHWDIPSCGEFNGFESTGDSVVSVEIKDEGIEADTFGEMTPLEAQLLAAALLAAAVQAQEER